MSFDDPLETIEFLQAENGKLEKRLAMSERGRKAAVDALTKMSEACSVVTKYLDSFTIAYSEQDNFPTDEARFYKKMDATLKVVLAAQPDAPQAEEPKP